MPRFRPLFDSHSDLQRRAGERIKSGRVGIDGPHRARMAKSNKKSSGESPATDDLSYGEALDRLESIVSTMEEEDLPLEALLAKYEDGKKLVELCQSRLAAAEIRIRQLEETPDGAPEAKPFSLNPDAETDV